MGTVVIGGNPGDRGFWYAEAITIILRSDELSYPGNQTLCGSMLLGQVGSALINRASSRVGKLIRELDYQFNLYRLASSQYCHRTSSCAEN
jgi:hypothetical protein